MTVLIVGGSGATGPSPIARFHLEGARPSPGHPRLRRATRNRALAITLRRADRLRHYHLNTAATLLPPGTSSSGKTIASPFFNSVSK